jgi:hypothetical protein
MTRQQLMNYVLYIFLITIYLVNSKNIHIKNSDIDDTVFVEEASPDLKCGNFSAPTFCDMVNWPVAKSRLVATDNQEMIIQMAFFNQPGTWNCKKEYKEMQCRIAFPKCSVKAPVLPPCRTSCEDFAKRCPGSDVSCEDLINNDKDCYVFNYESYIAGKEARVSGTSTLRGWPVVLLTFVVLGILYGLAFATQKAQKNFEKSQ